MRSRHGWIRAACLAGLVVAFGCAPEDEDDGGTEADEIGVGGSCSTNDDCPQPENDEDPMLECLTAFKGGYCGLEGCQLDEDCPEGSACVAHDDGMNYCFRICLDKSECNRNRGPDEEANCSANITFTDGGGGKACVPPSG